MRNVDYLKFQVLNLQMVKIEEDYITIAVNGIEVKTHYVTTRGKKDVTAMHGWAGSLDHWICHDDESGFLEAMSDKGYRVTAMDLIGHGYTEDSVSSTVYNNAELVRKLNERLEAEYPLVVGHSLGGTIALCGREVIRPGGVCLIDPTLFKGQTNVVYDIYYNSGRFSKVLDRLFMKSEIDKTMPFSKNKTKKWVEESAKLGSSKARRDLLRSGIETVRSSDLPGDYNRMNARKLTVTGEMGEMPEYLDMLNGVKVEMEGSGHCPHMDNSKKLASIIDEEFKLYL